MKQLKTLLLVLVLGGLVAQPAPGQELSDDALERWFESDELSPPPYESFEVNEGKLVFLAEIPKKSVHYHQNRLTISTQSLSSGWVWLSQCHDNLDKVERAQIVFKKGRTRDLHIVSSRNIVEAWIEENTIQLRDIHERARLCATAWTRALISHEDGSYSLRNGPFMRKFLDGYYPMHVTIDIDFADTGLELISILPVKQKGFDVRQSEGRIEFDAWFEGRLKTELRFASPVL